MSWPKENNISYYLFSIFLLVFYRYPLKAVKVMHTVALRTEATVVGGEKPENLGQAFKVLKIIHLCPYLCHLWHSFLIKKKVPTNMLGMQPLLVRKKQHDLFTFLLFFLILKNLILKKIIK